MLKIFCKITGDDYNILATETPESRKKVIAQGTVIFIPVIIWFIIGYLVSTKIMELNSGTGLLISSILALLIFILERTIIMAHGSKIINLFRVILGIVIAALGAIFLDEIIFAADIEHQIHKMQTENHETSSARVKDEYSYRIESSETNVNKLYTNWQSALNEAISEADGTGGSGQRGISNITNLKKDIADEMKNDYEIALAEYKLLIADQEAALQALSQENDNQNYKGILIRVKALFQLVFSDWVMALIYGLFTLFLFSMEFLVVLIKTGWQKTNYERRLEMIEEIGKRRMEMMMDQQSRLLANQFNPEFQNAKKHLQMHNPTGVFN